MKEIVQQELIALAQKITSHANQLNASQLLQEIRSLYEQAIILEYLTLHELQKTEPTPASNPINTPLKTTEIKGFGVASQSSSRPFLQETKTTKTEFSHPKFPPINNNITAQTNEPSLEDILAQVPKEPIFEQKNPPKEFTQKTLNDIASNKAIQFGLNDRIAFISHLFDSNEEDFVAAVGALNNLTSEQEAIRFIQQKIKPIFNNWIGKEEYEERFVEIVIRKYN